MKNRNNVLWLVGVLLLSMVSMRPALATVSVTPTGSLGTGEWIWQGTGNSIVLNLNILGVFGTGDYIALTSVNYPSSTPLTLISSSTLVGSSLVIAGTGSFTATATSLTNPSSTSAPFALGNTPQFGFTFYSASSQKFSSIYEVIQDSTYSYRLKDTASGNSFNFQATSAVTSVTPSAVPIPGSALLLGSGVIGLLGIGSRRKKDNA